MGVGACVGGKRFYLKMIRKFWVGFEQKNNMA